jgi:hypothetical protein
MTSPRRIGLDDPDLRLGAAGLVAGGAALAALPQAGGLPCPLRHATGIPCPLCGLTTSVTETLALDLPAAVAANPGGPVLVLLAVAVLAGPGRRLAVRPGLVYFALAAMWLWELHRFGVV